MLSLGAARLGDHVLARELAEAPLPGCVRGTSGDRRGYRCGRLETRPPGICRGRSRRTTPNAATVTRLTSRGHPVAVSGGPDALVRTGDLTHQARRRRAVHRPRQPPTGTAHGRWEGRPVIADGDARIWTPATDTPERLTSPPVPSTPRVPGTRSPAADGRLPGRGDGRPVLVTTDGQRMLRDLAGVVPGDMDMTAVPRWVAVPAVSASWSAPSWTDVRWRWSATGTAPCAWGTRRPISRPVSGFGEARDWPPPLWRLARW